MELVWWVATAVLAAAVTALVLAPARRGARRRDGERVSAAAFAALRESEERYRAFVAQSSDGIWCMEVAPPVAIDLPVEEQIEAFYQRATVVECNDAMARMYGYEAAHDLLGVRLGDMLPRHEERNLAFLRRFVAEGYRLVEAESREHDRHGNEKSFLNNLLGIVEDGRLCRVWGTQRDVTERHRLEEQLRQAQKMEAVGRLAGGVAHDFNNLLTAISGYSDLLATRLAPPGGTVPEVEEIKHAAQRASILTRQLLALGRRQFMAARVLSLNRIVADMERLLRRVIGEDIELITRLDPELAAVRADPGQLEQVILNLAVNARDAMPQGGRLVLETRNLEVTADDVAAGGVGPALAPGSYVVLAVSDDGVGIPENVREHIFEPFFTTKERDKGTGLGLATVYGIVEQSGGHVRVESQPQVGSTFEVVLPRTRDETSEVVVPRAEPAPASLRGSERILLVEDEEAVRKLVRRGLEQLGYEVLEAADGVAALALAEREPRTIDLLLTDVVMPRMGGVELARRLRRSRPGAAVVFISGYAESADQGLELDSSIDLLQKPFSTGHLARRLRERLDARPAVEASGPSPDAERGRTAQS